jgi:hypothetical protein
MMPTSANVSGAKSPVESAANAGGKHVNSATMMKISQT